MKPLKTLNLKHGHFLFPAGNRNRQLVARQTRRKHCAGHLTVQTDSAPSVVSVNIQTSSLLVHLGVVVAVERVAVTVTCWNTNGKKQDRE